MSGTKFSSERPKGDAYGIEDAVAAAVDEFMKTGHSAMIPCICVIGIKEVQVSAGDDGKPVNTPVVSIRRITSLTSDESIKQGQRLLMKAIREQAHEDEAQPLPLDEATVIMEAFGGVDPDQVELDDRELAEDQNLTDPDRLRRHLTKVHAFPADEVAGMEMADVQRTHQAHHSDLPASVMPHDVEWWEWRDVVLRERVAELIEAGTDWVPPDVASIEPGEPGDAEPPVELDDEAEIRAHLSLVHNFDDSLIGDEGLADLRSRHVRDHEEPPAEDPFPVHPLAWLGTDPTALDSGSGSAEDGETAADPVADGKTED